MKSKSTNFRIFFYLVVIMAVSVFTTEAAFCASNDDEYRAPDYDKIDIAIHNSSSENFYPKIFERYMKGDTTLTLDNYHHLYYGYSFNEAYSPIIANPVKDSLMVVMQQNRDGGLISPEIYNDLKRVAAKSLVYNPFDIAVLNILTFIYQMEGNEEKAKEYGYKVSMIKETILNSGHGMTKNSPFHVICRDEEEAIIASMGLEYTKRSYVNIDVEYFLLKGRYFTAKGLYFNIGRMWTKTPEEKKPAKKRFELNPYQNPKSDRYVSPVK